MFRKDELQQSSFEWTMEVALMEAVLKSGMDWMRRIAAATVIIVVINASIIVSIKYKIVQH